MEEIPPLRAHNIKPEDLKPSKLNSAELNPGMSPQRIAAIKRDANAKKN
jgi:hypothetical protein